MNTSIGSLSGALMCAKYSVPPNYFGYCGPDKNKTLRDQIQEETGDRETESILQEFETLYPYLEAIAYKNKIANPFDMRVVEAYWIGNRLLRAFSPQDYVSFLHDLLHVDKKIAPPYMRQLAANLISEAPVPHHTFHVMAVFRRTGADPSFQTLSTIDSCRINAGTISAFGEDGNLLVCAKLLEFKDGILNLTAPKTIPISTQHQMGSHRTQLNIGDLITFHWGMFCDTISPAQFAQLQFYTQKSIDFFNHMRRSLRNSKSATI